MENNYKTSFWKSLHFFLKSERTHMLGPPLPVRFCSLFKDPLLTSSTNLLFEWLLRMFFKLRVACLVMRELGPCIFLNYVLTAGKLSSNSNSSSNSVTLFIIKMLNVYSLISRNSLHIADIFSWYISNINGMRNARKLNTKDSPKFALT